MNEIAFVLFLLSGVIKPFLVYFHLHYSVLDFTLLSTVFLLILLIKNLHHHAYRIVIDKFALYSIILILTLFTMILFSLFYTSSESYAYDKTVQFFTVILGFFFPLLVKNFDVHKFLKWFLITTTSLAILYMPLFLSAYKMMTSNYQGYMHNIPIYLMYQLYLPMGYIIAIALIIISFLPIISGYKKVLIQGILFFILVITGARGPLFAFIAITILFIVTNSFQFKFIKPKLLTLVLSTSIILGGIFYAVSRPNITNILERAYDRIITIEKDKSANSRLKHVAFVIEKMDASHLFFGYGIGSYGIEKTKIDQRYYPHNMPLEILFELGSISLFIYFMLIFILIKKLYYIKEFVPWALFIFLIINSLKSLSLTDSRILFGFFAVILIYKSYQKVNINTKQIKNS